MANGLSDILSVYRQGLASERQSRQSEMQFALQAMQFESAQRFREEGRQRGDAARGKGTRPCLERILVRFAEGARGRQSWRRREDKKGGKKIRRLPLTRGRRRRFAIYFETFRRMFHKIAEKPRKTTLFLEKTCVLGRAK